MSGVINIRNREQLFIGGRWVAPAAGGRIELVNPATEEVFTRVAEAGEVDMDRAVAAARDAFDNGPWPGLTHAERGAKVAELASRLEARHAELAAAWTQQMGGLASFAPNVTGGGTFQLGYFASLANTYPFETRQPVWSRPSRRGMRPTPS
jgi:aldehyde dehydrogenase (NAD+)